MGNWLDVIFWWAGFAICAAWGLFLAMCLLGGAIKFFGRKLCEECAKYADWRQIAKECALRGTLKGVTKDEAEELGWRDRGTVEHHPV